MSELQCIATVKVYVIRDIGGGGGGGGGEREGATKSSGCMVHTFSTHTV